MSVSSQYTSYMDASQYYPSMLSMPPELLGYIFSFVGLRGLQECAGTSVDLSKIAIKEAKTQQVTQLRTFIDQILSRLSNAAASEEITNLKEIHSSLDADISNLSQLKQYLLAVKSQVLDVLTTLRESELALLEGIQVPYFYENIFAVARIYRQIMEVRDSPYLGVRENALKKASGELVKAGEIDRAINLINHISEKVIREHAFKDLSQLLCKVGEVERAIKVADCILDQKSFYKALLGIIHNCLEANELDRSLAIAAHLDNPSSQQKAWIAISNAYVKAGDLNNAIEVATRISDPKKYGSALLRIIKVLLKKEEFDRSIKLANTIENQGSLKCALEIISKALFQAGDFDRGIEIGEALLQQCSGRALRDVSNVVPLSGNC